MSDRDVPRLEAEARYARERYDLYRARSYGPRPSDPGRLRELERRSELAGRRVVAARSRAKRAN
jgi:hypothetical protein